MNSKSGVRPGSRDRRGIGPGRLPNTRAWSVRLPEAPSRMRVPRNGRGSIDHGRRHLEAPSGNGKNLVKAEIAPDLCADAPGKYLGCIPDVLKSYVKWREAVAHKVRRAESSYDTAFDHRLHVRITLYEGYSALSAAQ